MLVIYFACANCAIWNLNGPLERIQIMTETITKWNSDCTFLGRVKRARDIKVEFKLLILRILNKWENVQRRMLKWMALSVLESTRWGVNLGWRLLSEHEQSIDIQLDIQPLRTMKLFEDCDWHFHTRNWLSLTLFFPFSHSLFLFFVGIKNCCCFRLSWNLPRGLGESFGCSSGSVLRRLHWSINCGCVASVHSLPSG